MHCERLGSGPDVVLLHGWGWHGGVWDDVAPALAHRFRVWIPDLPGHGRSRDDVAEFTLRDIAQAVRNAVPTDAVWVGWSLGGSIALTAAQQGAARRLVLLGATPCFVQRPGWDCGWSAEWFAQFSADVERDTGAALTRFASLHLTGAKNERALLRRLRAERSRHASPDTDRLRAGLHVLREMDLRPTLSAITVPTRVMHGVGDRIVPAPAGEYLAKALSRATYLPVADAGHALPMSHSEIVVKIVTECCLE